VSDFDASTAYVVLLVLNVPALETVADVEYTTVPVVHVEFAPFRRAMLSEPATGAPFADEIVTESFGTHVWADVYDVVSPTVKHSLWLPSLDPV
jgi:hypothetical protein